MDSFAHRGSGGSDTLIWALEASLITHSIYTTQTAAAMVFGPGAVAAQQISSAKRLSQSRWDENYNGKKNHIYIGKR